MSKLAAAGGAWGPFPTAAVCAGGQGLSLTGVGGGSMLSLLHNGTGDRDIGSMGEMA